MIAALLLGSLALPASFTPPSPAGGSGSHIWDTRWVYDASNNHLTSHFTIHFAPGTSWVEAVLPRAENLPNPCEVAVFHQHAHEQYITDPPHVFEDRSEWYTRLLWPPGTLNGAWSISITVETDADVESWTPGLMFDLSRHPGDWYTEPTALIQNVPGIGETVDWIADNIDRFPAMAGGEHGLVQYWQAFVIGNFPLVPGGVVPGPDDAASAWNAGRTDVFGRTNIFAAGLRSLGFPVCVSGCYGFPWGPTCDENVIGRVRSVGANAWAGVWSDGMQAFVPLDLNTQEYGLLGSNRVQADYFDDLSLFTWLVESDLHGAWITSEGFEAHASNTGTDYPLVRVRRFDDHGDAGILAHEVLMPRAPGPVVGVPVRPDSTAPERLDARATFRDALPMNLRLTTGGRARVEVFDVQGRRVAVPVIERDVSPGDTPFRWLPEGAPNGLYFVRATLDDGRAFTARTVRSR